jgi:hypothetical protein
MYIHPKWNIDLLSFGYSRVFSKGVDLALSNGLDGYEGSHQAVPSEQNRCKVDGAAIPGLIRRRLL